MAKKNPGRVFIHTDTGALDIDRPAGRETRIVYYATSTSADHRVEVTLLRHSENSKLRIIVQRLVDSDHGVEATLLDVDVDA